VVAIGSPELTAIWADPIIASAQWRVTLTGRLRAHGRGV